MRTAVVLYSTVSLFALAAAANAAPEGANAKAAAALEDAYKVRPVPEILLSLAALYEQWPGHCKQAVQTYQRFFAACEKCDAQMEAVRRFDLTIERCVVTIDEEIAIREKLSVPRSKEPARVAGDATLVELIELVRDVRAVAPEKGASLLARLSFVATASKPSVRVLNELRTLAWDVLEKKNANPEQVWALLKRIKRVDYKKQRELSDELMAGLATKDPKRTTQVLNRVRTKALKVLETRSSGGRLPTSVQASCAPNAEREWGFVTVSTKPWSEVFLNGEKIGSTPVSKADALAGCVTVRAVTSSGREVVKNVTVKANAVAILTIDLNNGRDEVRYAAAK